MQTKGHELLTLDFTPQASDSDIFVDVSVPMSSSTTNIIGYALFMDDEAEALECTWSRISAPNAPSSPILMKHLLPKGITGSHTFKVRYGAYANPGDVSTVQVNGASGTRYLGGALESKITITEFPKGVIGGGSGGGEVQEAVVVTAKLDTNLPLETKTWTALPFNTIHDTNGSYDVANKQFKPSVAGFYQINYLARFNPAGGTVLKGNRQALELRDKDDIRVAYVSQDFDDTSNSNTTTLSTIVYFDGISDYVVPQVWSDYPAITIADLDQTLFSAHLITGQSTGGGSYTPEKMVWEDKSS